MNTKIIQAPCYQKPSGKLYLGSDQLNLIDEVPTEVLLDTIGTGFTDAIENTVAHCITPGQAGYYLVLGAVMFLNVVAAKNYRSGVLVNSTDYYNSPMYYAAGGVYFSVPTFDLIKLTATDYVQLIAISYSGDNTVDIQSGITSTFLSVQRVR